jgi:pimeloyl-ACP methyl ester carboxylesterase
VADAARIGRLAMSDERPAHLVGHSYGGAIALAVALRFPAHVASVTVFEPVPFGILIRSAPAAWCDVYAIASAIERGLATDNPEQSAQRFVDFWSGHGTWDVMPPGRRAAITRCMPTVAAHFASLSTCRGAFAGLDRMHAPLLHLASDGAPRVMPVLAALLHDALPDAPFETMRGMGHMGPVTHADVVAQRIARHLREQAMNVHARAASITHPAMATEEACEPA